MSSYISEDLRRQVIARAEQLCEYCLVHEEDTFFGCHIDHIISLKHGGSTSLDNRPTPAVFATDKKAATSVQSTGLPVCW